MLRKMLIIFVYFVFSEDQFILQVLAVQLLIAIAYWINEYCEPYEEKILNKIESINLVSIGIIIYCGLFYSTSINFCLKYFSKNKISFI